MPTGSMTSSGYLDYMLADGRMPEAARRDAETLCALLHKPLPRKRGGTRP